MRILIQYDDAPPRADGSPNVAPKISVSIKPETAVIKIASPLSGDHGVAMRLRLYEREWQFYEELASRVSEGGRERVDVVYPVHPSTHPSTSLTCPRAAAPGADPRADVLRQREGPRDWCHHVRGWGV